MFSVNMRGYVSERAPFIPSGEFTFISWWSISFAVWTAVRRQTGTVMARRIDERQCVVVFTAGWTVHMVTAYHHTGAPSSPPNVNLFKHNKSNHANSRDANLRRRWSVRHRLGYRHDFLWSILRPPLSWIRSKSSSRSGNQIYLSFLHSDLWHHILNIFYLQSLSFVHTEMARITQQLKNFNYRLLRSWR
jgi:hypothetical protein